MDKIQRHKQICEQLNKIYANKNADYGDSFGAMFQEMGIVTALTRIGDKYNRLKSLSAKKSSEQKVLDESLIDTALDAANYLIMTVIELENGQE